MFNPATATTFATMNTADLQTVATHCVMEATDTSRQVFAYCMRELAVRFDKRSFTNLCEAITRDVEEPQDASEWAARVLAIQVH